MEVMGISVPPMPFGGKALPHQASYNLNLSKSRVLLSFPSFMKSIGVVGRKDPKHGLVVTSCSHLLEDASLFETIDHAISSSSSMDMAKPSSSSSSSTSMGMAKPSSSSSMGMAKPSSSSSAASSMGMAKPSSSSSSSMDSNNIELDMKQRLPEEIPTALQEPTNHEDSRLILSKIWKEIQGEKNWEGLLEHPIHPILRAELIRYGEFAQVCYDAFDFDKHSKYCGSCKYNRKALFEKVDKWDCGYMVAKYLYATSKLDLPKFFRKSEREAGVRWSGDSNWIGYIAVSTDEDEIKRLGRRDIVIAWRGTVTATEWVDDLMATQTPANIEIGRPRPQDVKVETGFLSLYSSRKADSKFNKLSAREQMVLEVKKLLMEYQDDEISITITGHSLGAALALLSAYDIAANLAQIGGAAYPSPAITVFSFSGPRVGNRAFKERVEELGVKVLRVVNIHDGVPNVPGVFFNERGCSAVGHWLRPITDTIPWGYHHVGAKLLVDLDVSPHLRRTRDLACHHNLEAHLHVLDGFHGAGRSFESMTGRSPVLVNKASGFLRRDTFIPPFWWQESNKGLVKNALGQWVLASRDDEHLPESP